MVEISTSLLSVKKENAIKTIYNLETAGTNYFHIDVMDGVFVKNNTNTLMNEYCEYIKNISNVPLDVHLMVQDVEYYIKNYIIYNPNILTFHYEAVENEEQIMNLVNYIKQNNCKVGISIKPSTDISKIYKILPYIHLVLIMTVEPGEGGQKLIESTIQKIQELNNYIIKNNLDTDIQVDGGITVDNVELVKQAGANIIVSGSEIIKSNNYKQVIQNLKK